MVNIDVRIETLMQLEKLDNLADNLFKLYKGHLL